MPQNQKNQLRHDANRDITVSADRLTRLNETVEGSVSLTQLPDLVDFLASEKGEIHYRFVGKLLTDQLARQKRVVKCIISGWFEVSDRVSLLPTRFDLAIDSTLVLVESESALPPLEEEADDEDYVVCGAEFDVLARIQEEILLALPAATPRKMSKAENEAEKRANPRSKSLASPTIDEMTDQKLVSPFAKLAALKRR
jgi:uncharacterized protein